MTILFDNKNVTSAKVSIVLLDWSCRESFHMLDYLSHQTLPRERYEVIWIEFYSRRASGISDRLKECERAGKHPPVDRWIIMGMPDNVYYHKHLMYNTGIVASRGEIIVLCDSDAVVSPTFVESIIGSFNDDPNIVLHLDEVRNIGRGFYPFNYPSLEEITGEGCINWKDGKTTGLLDREDQIHTRNYGACMCALRDDLVNIGGADEHNDYLGHICGPYELTFRLVNAGKKEVWHHREFLYHIWHPGTDGLNNYLGPHDGKNMSTTALDVKRSGRTLPLVENPAIRALRLDGNDIFYVPLLSMVIPELEIGEWTVDSMRKRSKPQDNLITVTVKLKLLLLSKVFCMCMKQLFSKVKNYGGNKAMPRSTFFECRLPFIFFRRMWKNNIYAVRICQQIIEKLASEGIKDCVICGVGDIARVLCMVAKEKLFKIENVHDRLMVGKKFLDFHVSSTEALRGYAGKVIVASFVEINDKVKALKEMGIDDENIIRLQ